MENINSNVYDLVSTYLEQISAEKNSPLSCHTDSTGDYNEHIDWGSHYDSAT